MNPTLPQKLMAKELRHYNSEIIKIYDSKKRKLFSSLKKSDRILEIGAGTGVNFQYYPFGANLTVVEPNPLLRVDIETKAKKFGLNIVFHKGVAEKLPFNSSSFDVVVSSLVLCSVKSMAQSLKEIKRVLREDGKYLFIEHVVDNQNLFRRFMQNLVLLFGWSFFGDNCHPNRDITHEIKKTGFSKLSFKKYYPKGLGFFGQVIKSHIAGFALK